MQRRARVLLIAAAALLVASLGFSTPVTVADPLEVSAAAAPVASVLPRHLAKHTTGSASGRSPQAPKTCRAGLVALTFDDGPSSTVTPVLVRTLVEHDVPATFFMVGSRIHTAPAAGQMVQRNGFTIGNHTWSHADLPRLSGAEIRHQLRSTGREMRAHGIVPSTLMRPPYGDISQRVRHVVHDLGLVPVLWTIDSRDWAGGTPAQIANRILAALHRHGTNIVLQHDGVTNSPNSVAAVPRVVRIARQRGFCFTHLGPRGGPARIAAAGAKHAGAATPSPIVSGRARVLAAQFVSRRG